MLTSLIMTCLLGAPHILAAPVWGILNARSDIPNDCEGARLRSEASTNILNATLERIIPVLNKTTSSNILALNGPQFAGQSITKVQGDIDSYANTVLNNLTLPTFGSISLTQFDISGNKEEVRSIGDGAEAQVLKNAVSIAIEEQAEWALNAAAAVEACVGFILTQAAASAAEVAKTRTPRNSTLATATANVGQPISATQSSVVATLTDVGTVQAQLQADDVPVGMPSASNAFSDRFQGYSFLLQVVFTGVLGHAIVY